VPMRPSFWVVLLTCACATQAACACVALLKQCVLVADRKSGVGAGVDLVGEA